jgi:hypothetical protein
MTEKQVQAILGRETEAPALKIREGKKVCSSQVLYWHGPGTVIAVSFDEDHVVRGKFLVGTQE